MHPIELSGLLGTRESADDVIARAALPGDLHGHSVVLFCRDLLTGSTSFADQLVKVLLVDRAADEVVLIGAPERFSQHMAASSTRRELSGRVRSETAAHLGV